MKRSKQQEGLERAKGQLGKAVQKMLTDKQKYDEKDDAHVRHVTGKGPVKEDKKDG